MHQKRKYHWENAATKELFEAVMKLRTTDEAHRFFRDLCTPEEIDEMARRWQTAKMLAEGELSYRDIADEAGVSTSTVARVAQWLYNGRGGYPLILRRLGLSVAEKSKKK